jgi:voltage-gated potassium channel
VEWCIPADLRTVDLVKAWARAVLSDIGDARARPDQPLVVWILFRLRGPLIALGALGVVATLGYMVIEGYGWVDAVYMTVITLGTIGYGEVHTLGTGGRLFTVGVVVASFATFVYAASVLTSVFTSGEATRHMHERRSKIMRDALQDHVIVVGFGRVGQAVVRSLREMDRQCVVLDTNADHATAIEASGAMHVCGDATSEADLASAGIARAAAFVAAADQDSANLVVVLTARAVRPDLRIVSRVNEASWLSRMKHAGADVAQSPYDSYGASLAASALSPAVLDLHDLPLLGLGTEEIIVGASSPFIGKSLSELVDDHVGVYVLGLRRDQQLHKWHDITDTVREGDVLVVLGTSEHLAKLARASRIVDLTSAAVAHSTTDPDPSGVLHDEV